MAWFGALVRRWIDYRLAAEKASAQTTGMQAAALARFGGYLERRDATSPQLITRSLLIDYLAELKRCTSRRRGVRAGDIGKWMSAINTFLDDVRLLEWEPRIPGSARYLSGEQPRRPVPQPRFISENVMMQLERGESLAKIERDDFRLAVKILMTTGMRISTPATLPLNCLEELPRSAGESAWALLFVDTKTRQPMRIPLRPDIALAVQEQQAQVLGAVSGDDCPLLLPARRNGAIRHIAPQTFHTALGRWCEALGLRDENGAPVRVTAHQFRHTCGTQWINHNVPQRVVMKLLGHRTERMTSVYAHLHDQTAGTGRSSNGSTSRAAGCHPRTMRPPMSEWDARRTYPALRRPCPTAIARCRSSRAARTPTPALPATVSRQGLSSCPCWSSSASTTANSWKPRRAAATGAWPRSIGCPSSTSARSFLACVLPDRGNT